MHERTLHWSRRGLIMATATLAMACAGESAIAPDAATGSSTQRAASPLSANEDRSAPLEKCATLTAPAGSRLVAHVYATGVQIYRWNGTAWVFVAPEAVLSADASGNSTVGTHYAGPTWESNSGSTVVGVVSQRCTVGATDIPWLSLTAASSSGPGIFQRVSFIQRVNTMGGVAPSLPGTTIGQEARVPYTAEYYFYRP